VHFKKTAIGDREFRPCHRCGWVMPVTKVSRVDARALGVRGHTRLCDECVADLRGNHLIGLGTSSIARPAPKILHRRHVA
jgi:hypothetical protein